MAETWLAPDHRAFKVVDAGNHRYILGYDVLTNAWTLSFYDVSG